jgi:hypothetical protein
MRLAVALGAGCALVAACATTSTPPAPPAGSVQDLRVETDPPGAACSILHDGDLVAAIEATPATAAVTRDVCRKGNLLCEPTALEVVCRKDGYLEVRRTVAPVLASTISDQLGPPPELTPEQEGVAMASAIAYLGAMAVPPVALPLAVGAFVGQASMPRQYMYAYPTPSVLLLPPATCVSEAACDASFAAMKDKFTARANARKAEIDAACHYFPCRASDMEPCPHPECQKQRASVDAELESRLAELSALRARVRVTGAVAAPGAR